jgi:hypothetical protein
MPIPNVSSLYSRIHKGSEGGNEFARILNQLLIADSKDKGQEYIVSSDASGDYKGVDGILRTKDEIIGFQFKFYPNTMSSSQKSSVFRSFSNAVEKFPEMTQWILVIPEDLDSRMMTWFQTKLGDESVKCLCWGHKFILDLMLKHVHIGERYYPELSTFKLPSEPSIEDCKTFFIQFTQSLEKAQNLLLNAQPSFADCKQIFSSEYAGYVSDMYHSMYQGFLENDRSYELLEKNRVKIDSSTISDIQNSKDQLPGGMRQIFNQNNALKAGARFYSVHFLNDNDEWGIGFSVWCYINGRWVFFPKPWRVIRSIQAVRNSKDNQRLIKLLKMFGFRKYVVDKNKVDLGIMINFIADELRNSS